MCICYPQISRLPTTTLSLLPSNQLNYVGQRSPTFLAPGTSFVEDNFSSYGWERRWFSGNTSDGKGWGAADEALLAPHRSCPAVLPGSQQAVDQYWFAAQRLGTADVGHSFLSFSSFCHFLASSQILSIGHSYNSYLPIFIALV